MNADEYQAIIAALGITQRQAADLLGVSHRSSAGYATGQPIPGPVARLLTLYRNLGLAEAVRVMDGPPPPLPPPSPVVGANPDSAGRYTAHGKTQTLAQWATELCMPRRTLESRLRQYGWTVEQALTPGRGKPGPRQPGASAPVMTARPVPPRQPRARYEDIAGRVYGHLTAVAWAGDKSWHCRCVCGTMKTVAKTNLRSGRQTSCGCGGAGPAPVTP